MSRWSFWEWIAYAGLFIAAIIIAADQGLKLAPALFPKFSDVLASSYWAFAPLALFLLSTAILGAREFGWIGSSLEDTAELQLRYLQGNPVPNAVSQNNIWRWYSLQNNFRAVTASGVVQGEITNIFINFEKPVKVGTLVLSSADYVIPRHEVKEFNNKFAIIAIDQTPPGILDIKVVNR